MSGRLEEAEVREEVGLPSGYPAQIRGGVVLSLENLARHVEKIEARVLAQGRVIDAARAYLVADDAYTLIDNPFDRDDAADVLAAARASLALALSADPSPACPADPKEPPASDPRPDPRTHPEHWTE